MAGLNTEQQKAVDLNADKILCLAGAGTGKPGGDPSSRQPLRPYNHRRTMMKRTVTEVDAPVCRNIIHV